MKYMLITIITLLLCICVNAQSNNTEVELLYRSLSEKPIEYETIADSLIVSSEAINKENAGTILDVINLPPPYDYIFFKRYNYLNPEQPYIFRDSLLIMNTAFGIDNLFNGNKFDALQEPLHLSYLCGYRFNICMKSYIALYFFDYTMPNSNPNFYITLFDITDPDKITAYALAEQASYTPYCFGDFNNDGKLDYIQWEFEEPVMEVYTLENKTFHKLNGYKVYINQTKEGSYFIDRKKSKWFYSLNDKNKALI